MTVAATSIKAYSEMHQEGTIGLQERKILEIMDWCMTYSLRELCEMTKIDINAMSGRVNGLKKKGLIRVMYRRPCQITGRVINAVCLTNKHADSKFLKKVPMFNLEKV